MIVGLEDSRSMAVGAVYPEEREGTEEGGAHARERRRCEVKWGEAGLMVLLDAETL